MSGNDQRDSDGADVRGAVRIVAVRCDRGQPSKKDQDPASLRDGGRAAQGAPEDSGTFGGGAPPSGGGTGSRVG